MKLKKKLGKRIGSLESLRAKMHAKYGAEDNLVIELDREIEELRGSYARLNAAKIEPVASRKIHSRHTQL
jgi:hypothetical protein